MLLPAGYYEKTSFLWQNGGREIPGRDDKAKILSAERQKTSFFTENQFI
jgi:hypothetical protein